MRLSALLGALGLVLVVPASSWGQAVRWQIGSAPSLSSGTYGTDSRTEVIHTPFSIRRLFPEGDLALVVPFTCVRGDSQVTIVGDTPTRTTTTQIARTSECGLGDVIVRGRYYLVDEHDAMPTIAVRAHIKLRTASASRGLGTGKADAGVGVEVSRTVGGNVLLMADAGFTAIGQPAGDALNNSYWFDVGAGRDISRSVNLAAFFESYRALVPGLEDARDILGAVTLKGTNGWRVQIAGMIGLTEGAPDHALTIGASRRF